MVEVRCVDINRIIVVGEVFFVFYLLFVFFCVGLWSFEGF